MQIPTLRCFCPSVLVFGILLLVPAPAPAQSQEPAGSAAKAAPLSTLDRVVNTLFATRGFEQAQISPDGKQVAWVETLTGSTAIFVAPVEGGRAPQRVTVSAANPHAEGGIAWSTDSQQIAFLSDAAKEGQLQLYVSDADGGAPRKLTDVTGFLAAPGWSPDGKTIAILVTENATRAAGNPSSSRPFKLRIPPGLPTGKGLLSSLA